MIPVVRIGWYSLAKIRDGTTYWVGVEGFERKEPTHRVRGNDGSPKVC